MHYVLNFWLRDVPEWTSLFCCLQLVITIICQMASSAATSIYAQGNIKWYAIYKSLMNIAPIIMTYMAYAFGGAPYWLYIAMITIWSIGGDMVIMQYANKVSKLKKIAFLREVVFPVIIIVLFMLAFGYLPQLLMEEGFFRLVVSCIVTSLVFVLIIWLYIFTSDERQMVNNLVGKTIFAKFKR